MLSDIENFSFLVDEKDSIFINRKKNVIGEISNMSDIIDIILIQNSVGISKYKTNFEETSFEEVSLLRSDIKTRRN